jgi:lipopolysaccharide transport system permease protein
MTALRVLLNPNGHLAAGRQLVDVLSRHRQLTWEFTKRELQERYAGQMLGTVWTLGHPLLLMALYVFVFGYVFRIRIAGETSGADYAAYLLAGLIPWLAFQESMTKGTTVIVQSAGLVKQVVFPVEILPVKGVLASIFTELVCFAVLFAYVVWRDAFSWMWLLLPALLAVQALAMIGTCYVLASVGVFIRDVKDIVVVFTVAGLYLMPTLYAPGTIPEGLVAFFWFNPFSHMVWCFQDVIYFRRIVHPTSWLAFPLLSAAVFYLGFRVFRRLRPMFGDAL